MNEKIRFEKHFQSTRFHNPMMEGALDTQELEIRRDPLTGRQSVLNPRLEDKVALFFTPTDPALIERLVEESEPNCFLCADRWQRTTPTYPESLLPEGRIRVGEAVLFPNLFPVAQIHAVIRVGEGHYMPLGAFDAGRVVEAFQTAIAFTRALARSDGSLRYMTVNGNYLGPGGASLVHPHFQVAGGDLPFTHLEDLYARSGAHFERHGSCYWTDLVEAEQEAGERYIGRTGPVEWVTSFSPQGTNEVLGVLPAKGNFLELDDGDLEGFALGLSAVLKGYDALGLSTFNFTIYSDVLGGGDGSFRCFLRIISRQNVYENYRTDDYFLQKLLRNELILVTPEALAAGLGKVFGDFGEDGE